jgi:hypothetical protein
MLPFSPIARAMVGPVTEAGRQASSGAAVYDIIIWRVFLGDFNSQSNIQQEVCICRRQAGQGHAASISPDTAVNLPSNYYRNPRNPITFFITARRAALLSIQ